MNLNTLLNLFNLFQLRAIRSDLAKLTAQPRPMPETDLTPELYESGRIQVPPPNPNSYRYKFTDAEWNARMDNPALSKQERSAILDDYRAEKAMNLMAEASPESVCRMVRSAAEIQAAFDQEVADSAISALELKFNGPK
jgi:hypothetical protein